MQGDGDKWGPMISKHTLKTLVAPGGGVASQMRNPKPRQVFLPKVRQQVNNTFEPRTAPWLDLEGVCSEKLYDNSLQLPSTPSPSPGSGLSAPPALTHQAPCPAES